MTTLGVIVLAAGLGTRMKSAKSKVLHKAAHRSLLGHVLTASTVLRPATTIVVTGPDMPEVGQEALTFVPGAHIAIQAQRLGTADAVRAAIPELPGNIGTVLILYGDCPLVPAIALDTLVNAARPFAVLAFNANRPHGYGRVLLDDRGHVSAIIEELDATREQKLISLCNSGIIAIQASLLKDLLGQITATNAKGEYYLTDLFALASARDCAAKMVLCAEDEVMGVNDRQQLAKVENILQNQYRGRAMRSGATLIDPDTVYFAADTHTGQDVLIEPNVFFGPGVRIEDGVEILGHCHIEGTHIAQGARIGPFARLRPGSAIGSHAHIGNFVEIKNSDIAAGAKANHLTYLGDASVGAKSNIGAGTITCNYDGFLKHRTSIGANVFVGSNSALVAPVRVGDGANIAAGTVLTKDVPADAMAISRPELLIREGRAVRYRESLAVRKSAMTRSASAGKPEQGKV